MNPLPGKCPVCSNTLTVTRLQCGQCGTGIDGAFVLGRLMALTPEQVQFVEVFLKNKGKIKDVEADLGISYPTVVARLNEVVRAMGYEVDESEMSDVDRYEFYEAQVINPQTGGPNPLPPMPPTRPMTPMTPPTPTAAPHVPAPRVPAPRRPRLTDEEKERIFKDLAEGKISADEAMRRLNG
jgi:hypothetical protein